MPADPSIPEAADTENAAEHLWQISGMSPAAVAAARAAARRAGIPLAVWLSGLIHAVADREQGDGDPGAGQ